MSKDNRDSAQLALLVVLVVSWLGLAAYSVWKDRELKRASDAFQKRMMEHLDLGRWESEI